MDELEKLLDKKKELYAKIKEFGKRFDEQDKKWKDEEERGNWEKLNADYDALNAQIGETRDANLVAERLQGIDDGEEQRRSIPGLDDTSNRGRRDQEEFEGELRGMNREAVSSLALAGFLRNINGLGIEDRHVQAMRASRISPHATQLEFAGFDTEGLRSMQQDFDRTPIGLRDNSRFREIGSEERAQSSFLHSTGGALVPRSMATSIEVNMLRFGGIREAVDVMTTQTGEPFKWPTSDDTSEEGIMLGENRPVQDPADINVGDVTWNAYEFSSNPVRVPNSLLEDSFINLSPFIGEMLGKRIGRATSRKYIGGTGAAQPYGLKPLAALGRTSTYAASLTYDDFIELEHSVDPAYRMNARFVMHDSVLKHIRLIKDSEGRPLWQPSLQMGIADAFNGRQITIDQYMDAALAQGNTSVLYGDMSRYKVRRVRNIRFVTLRERYADSNQVGFLAFVREDGNLLQAGTNPIAKMVQGSGTP